MKKCKQCNKLKQPSEFYRHPNTADGLFSVCGRCHRARTQANYRRKAKVKREAAKQAYRRRVREGYYKTYQRDPEKVAAKVMVANAKASGRLVPRSCRVCRSKKVEAHHPDYGKPLEVVWLCRKHHKELHRMEPPAWARKVG